MRQVDLCTRDRSHLISGAGCWLLAVQASRISKDRGLYNLYWSLGPGWPFGARPAARKTKRTDGQTGRQTNKQRNKQQTEEQQVALCGAIRSSDPVERLFKSSE